VIGSTSIRVELLGAIRRQNGQVAVAAGEHGQATRLYAESGLATFISDSGVHAVVSLDRLRILDTAPNGDSPGTLSSPSSLGSSGWARWRP
jgi:hypothetical protein